jgi:hypothetical protein
MLNAAWGVSPRRAAPQPHQPLSLQCGLSPMCQHGVGGLSCLGAPLPTPMHIAHRLFPPRCTTPTASPHPDDPTPTASPHPILHGVILLRSRSGDERGSSEVERSAPGAQRFSSPSSGAPPELGGRGRGVSGAGREQSAASPLCSRPPPEARDLPRSPPEHLRRPEIFLSALRSASKAQRGAPRK